MDKLTYAGNRQSLADVAQHPRFVFVQADIADRAAVDAVYRDYHPTWVVNFAAESHVDRSIDGPRVFIRPTSTARLNFWMPRVCMWRPLMLRHARASVFCMCLPMRSTAPSVPGACFPKRPHTLPILRMLPPKPRRTIWCGRRHETYGLPTLITNCSNNYGPYQFPEKLIPLMILNALEGKSLPIYGDGGNIRDWLFVEDHCEGFS